MILIYVTYLCHTTLSYYDVIYGIDYDDTCVTYYDGIYVTQYDDVCVAYLCHVYNILKSLFYVRNR